LGCGEKALFALEESETPEALEGLAKAAFFLDEAELTLEARRRSQSGQLRMERVYGRSARCGRQLGWMFSS